MAYNNGGFAFRGGNGTTGIQDDSWKAQGFLNLALPGKDGQPKKLGAIPLRESNAREKALLERLNKDPEFAKVILSKLIIEYRSAVQGDQDGFDLG